MSHPFLHVRLVASADAVAGSRFPADSPVRIENGKPSALADDLPLMSKDITRSNQVVMTSKRNSCTSVQCSLE
ncbi:hypothetical protein D9M71_669930 [compost metagenome]